VENEVLPTEVIQQFSNSPVANSLISKRMGDKNFGDVMVVGGGVSGIQASLDLATAGFKVYLVEKSPSIGGHMAQLDKTFPTNDCSM
jgi:heterodisulfide reductase subunit A